MYVWSGSAWVSVASEVESLATYATQSYASSQPGMKMVVPTSVAVGSGTGSVDTNGAVTFSAASSVSLNGCFSSTYDNYRILLNITSASASAILTMKMRASGTDTSGTSYRSQLIKATTTSVSGAANVSGTDDWYVATTQSAFSEATFFSMDILSPNLAAYTKFHNQGGYYDSSTNPALEYNYGFLSNSTQYDGFSIISSGTITGTIRVYGYKN